MWWACSMANNIVITLSHVNYMHPFYYHGNLYIISRPDIPILIHHSVSHWLHGVFAMSFALLDRVRITPREKLLQISPDSG